MNNENQIEYFQSQSMLATLLRKLRLDVPLLIVLASIFLLGLFILYSTSDQAMLIRQAIHMAIAFIVMLFLAQINPINFKRYSCLLYTLGIGLLISVLVIGEVGKGAQRWLDLGFMRFQPSEIIKITTPMMIAWYLAERPLPPSWGQLGVATVLIAIPALLIAKQPDLGTALLVASSGAAVLFFAGLSWKIIVTIGSISLASTPILWYFMHAYQRNRIMAFITPEADPMGKGYHIIQSKIAIGSGGLFGKGWQSNTQSHLQFLPETSTDFIFSVLAEEFGLAGCLGVLLLYLLIIVRCFYISVQAQDTYSRLLCGSLGATFFVYIFVNIGMVVGILPVVGVPLPLISYGGSSMVTLLVGFGIIMSIHSHRKLLSY